MKLTSSLGKLVFRKIFLAYIIIAALLTGYQIYTQYDIAKKIVNKELVLVEKSFYNVLSNSVWHLNSQQILDAIDAILNSNIISGVSIYTPKDEILGRKGILDIKEQKNSTFLFAKDEKVEFSQSLIKHTFFLKNSELSQDEVLANVNFYINDNAVFSLIEKNIYLIIVSAVIVTLALWLLFIYYIYNIITVPIKKLTEATKTFDTKQNVEVDIKFHNNYSTELNALAYSFNKMSKKIVEDFYRQTKLTKELAFQKEKLLESHRYKNFFLSNISHELKTPLNTINLISSVMARNKNSTLLPKDVENMKIINKAGNDLKVLIDDILDITKIESGDISIVYQKIEVEAKLDELYKMFEQAAKKKGLTFQMQNSLEEKYMVCDEKRFTQICKNLISNAIKFTQNGFVRFELFQRNETIVVSVKDSGIGIDEKSLETIFDKFKQVDADINRKYTGSGLGLAISKELAILLQGDIKVLTKVNEGSLFEFFFPKKGLDEVSIISSTQNKKEESLAKVEVQEKKEKKEEKRKVVLLNTNPLLFFKLEVALKKCKFLTFVQLQTKKEFITYGFKADDFLIFEDSIEFLEKIKKLKEEEGVKTLAISNNKKEFYDFCMEKPMEEEIIKIFEEDKNEKV